MDCPVMPHSPRSLNHIDLGTTEMKMTSDNLSSLDGSAVTLLELGAGQQRWPASAESSAPLELAQASTGR